MSASTELEMRPFERADLPAVRELYRKVWSENRDERYDAMRFTDTLDGLCPGVVAMDGRVCAGFYMVWPMPLTDGRRVVSGGQSIDTMTSPDHQGRGIFTRLAAACYRLCAESGMEVLFGAPNAASYPGFMRRLSWDHPCDIVTCGLPLSLAGAVPFGRVADRALSLLGRGSLGAGYEVEEREPAQEELSALLSEAGTPRSAWSVARSPEWYRFRYQAAGGSDYLWICLRRGGSIRGLSILGFPRAAGGRLRRANLSELIAMDENERRMLSRATADAARRRGRNLLVALTTRRETAATLRKSGFFRLRRAPLIARTLGPSCFEANPFAPSWDLFGADFDYL
jgi:GNAT superfamily N-acetyltransferase